MNRERLNGGLPGETVGIRPLGAGAVRLGGFLGERVARNERSILAGAASPIVDAHRTLAAGEAPETRRGSRLSDLYKWVEGCAAALLYAGAAERARLGAELERVSDVVARAAETLLQQEMSEVHNLYVAGHFFQAAVVHARATGSERLLSVALRWAERLRADFAAGHAAFQNLREASHPCVELGLVLLARASGRPELRRFARQLVGCYDLTERVGDLACGSHRRHAVCVEYLLTGLAELLLEEPDEAMRARLVGLWDELVSTRLYVAGGIGYDEIIPKRPFDLPQFYEGSDRKDVAETCASIGLAMLTRRVHALTGESRCFDVIETALYNHLLGGLSLDHLGVYYYNPLRLTGETAGKTDLDRPLHARTFLPELHKTSCCITNAWRFFATLPEYVFAVDGGGLYVNLYTTASASFTAPGGAEVWLDMETAYPHEGRVTLRVDPPWPVAFTLRLRIPHWCREATLTLPDGARVRGEAGRYLEVERSWHMGERLVLDLPMPVRVLTGDPRIQATAGCGVLARGPLVYCLEREDAPVAVERCALAVGPGEVGEAGEIRAEWRPDLLGGVYTLEVPVRLLPKPTVPAAGPYHAPAAPLPRERVTLIPYYARGNRSQPTGWATWMPFAPGGVSAPAQAP